MPSVANKRMEGRVSEQSIGRALLKDLLLVGIAVGAILAFYFFVQAFSILANIPP